MHCTWYESRVFNQTDITTPNPHTHTHTHTHTSPRAIITEAYPVFISRRTAAKYPDKYRFLCKLIVSALSAACFFPLKCFPFVNRLTKTKPTEYQIFCPLTFPTLTSRQNWELWFECTSASRAAPDWFVPRLHPFGMLFFLAPSPFSAEVWLQTETVTN